MVLFRYESGGVVLFDRAAAPFIDLSGFPTNSTDSLRSSLSRFLAEKLAATGYVEMIYMSAIDKEVDLWTVVTEDSEPVREKLYNVELEILKRFKDVLFDFHIYFKDDVSPEQFDGDPHIQRIYP